MGYLNKYVYINNIQCKLLFMYYFDGIKTMFIEYNDNAEKINKYFLKHGMEKIFKIKIPSMIDSESVIITCGIRYMLPKSKEILAISFL
jgi:hypothetical protein